MTRPPHRPIELTGLHAYADRESLFAGERITFFVSSKSPYDIEIRRLGTVVGDRSTDTIVATQSQTTPQLQPIHPGSYVHTNGLSAGFVLSAVTIECWVRPYSISGFAGLLTQHDYPSACSYGLFVDETRQVRFYLGDGHAYNSSGDWRTGVFVTPGLWHHIVGTWDGRTRYIYLNGACMGISGFSDYVAGCDSPLRLGAYGSYGVAAQFLDGDLAMPVLYPAALKPAEVQERFHDRGRSAPSWTTFGCWPFADRAGDLTPDVSGDGRHGTIINNGTWKIGGPSFGEAKVTQHSPYDPDADPDRGSSVRFARDDLHDCGWSATDSFVMPAAPAGLYAARFVGGGQETWVTFVLRARRSSSRPRVVVLANTQTWRAYNSMPFGEGHGDAPVHSCYLPHLGGQPGFQVGLRIPVPVAAPDTIAYATPYHHLVRAEHFTHAWLEAKNYAYDVIADSDLDREGLAALAGCSVLVLAGHAEYWTTRMFDTVEAWLDSGGSLVSLTGNAVWWSVAYDRDRQILECRKVGPDLGSATNRWGESWHAADGRRGGLLRDRGRSWSKLSGLMFLAYTEAATEEDFAPYRVVAGDHPLFRTPIDTGLGTDDMAGIGMLAAVGHEYDVTIETLLQLTQQPVPPGAVAPAPELGIVVLASSVLPCSRAFDYYGRKIVKNGTEVGATDKGGEMITWARPSGGRVFNAGSVNAGSTLWTDPAFAALVTNVLASFGEVPRSGIVDKPAFDPNEAPAAIHPNGTLLKGRGPKVYLICDGAKLWIPSAEEFLALGFKWSTIQIVDDRYLRGIATFPQDGSLLKERSKPTVVVLQGGCGFVFPSEESFTSLGHRWENVHTVPDGTFGRLRRCPREGTLLKEADRPEVYIARDGELRWVSSEERFEALGLDWNAIRTVPSGSVAGIPKGPAI